MSKIVRVSKPVAADPGLFFTVNLSDFSPEEVSEYLHIYTTIKVGEEEDYARLNVFRPENLANDLVVLLPYNAYNYGSVNSIDVTIHVSEKKNGDWVDLGEKVPAYEGTLTELNQDKHLVFKPTGETPPDQGNNDVRFVNVIASSQNGLGLQVDLSSVDVESIPPNDIEDQGVIIDLEVFSFSGASVSPKVRVRRNRPIELLVPLIIVVPYNTPSTASEGLYAKVWVQRNHISQSPSGPIGSDPQPYNVPITKITNSAFTYELVPNFPFPQ